MSLTEVVTVGLCKTDKVTLAGLYISKFDKLALSALGFTGMWHAFNVLGYALGAGPASIKNYRDEFDRIFPDNPRKGWNRPLKKRSEKILNEYNQLDFEVFTDLIKSFLIPNYEVEKSISSIWEPDINESLSKRLTTGLAAESYFKQSYSKIKKFREYQLTDVTTYGCGFDFKLSSASDYYCVEVKGLGASKGGVLLTEKEYTVANKLRNQYCLFIVTNFIETPRHQFFFDPLNSGLAFQKSERTITQTNYTAQI
jgi:hypothetical protein